VAAPPQTLEALVRDELRAPIQEIVRRLVPELVAEALLNGAAPQAADTTETQAPSTKVCRTCGREKPADQFAPNRRVCKVCRREQGRSWEEQRVARRRMQVDDDEEEP
jgi:hypothetical protein